MAGENLSLKIIGTLNVGATIGEINGQLKGIEKKIEKLTLNIKIDDKVSKSLSDFSKAMENHKKIAEDLNRVIREEKVVTKEADGVVREKIKQHLKSGEVIEKEIERINKKNKATQEEKEVTGQLINELDKLGRKQKEITRQNAKEQPLGSSQKYRNNFTDTTYTANKNGELTSTRTVLNLDQQSKAVEALNQQFLKLKTSGELSEKTITKMGNSINSALLHTSQGAELAVSEIDKLRNRLNTLDAGVKIRQANQELEKQLELYKRSAEMQVTALKNNNHKILSDDQKVSLQNYLNSVRALNVNTPQLQHTMRQLSLDFREVSVSAETAAHGQMSMLEMFRTAMTKFPVWMAATTAFYGSLNALKGAIGVIVEVDTRLTNLKKVMDQDTNFVNIMDNARVSAEKFGKTLTEVLDAYTEFARQGYKEQDLYNLGDAGLVTSNVGEMAASQAAQYLTSAMVQYNVATKDSMKVIDAWNNVSNKNATTVEKLASGMSKAGATANAFGLDMDHLNAIIGTVTAATKQSGNEVGNFVKSVLPRLLGQPAQDALKSLNINFIDQKTGDMRNVVDIYGEVAEKVKDVTKTEKMAVMEGLAGKLHISRMTALIDNWDMYNKILKDSKNSAGSAAQENERYMKSLEARIASMKVAVQEIALSLGKAFLTDGFIETLNAVKILANGFAGLADIVGGLPLILSTTGIAVTLLNTKFKALALEGTGLSRLFTTLGITAKGLQVALASVGVGAVLFGVGAALEYLLKKQSEATQKAEELKRKNQELVASYKENRSDIKSLSDEYETLGNKIKSGVFETKDIERYKKVTNELAQLMPDLVTGEDQYGNKIIGSNEKIKSKIELLEKQTAVQEKLDAIQKKEDTQDSFDSSKKDLKSGTTKLKSFFYTDDNQTQLRSIKEVYDEIGKYQDKLAKGKKLSFGENYDYKSLINTKDAYEKLAAEVDDYKLSYQKSVMDMIDVNVKLDSNTSQTTKSLIDDFTTFVATSDASASQINGTFDKLLNKVKNDDSFGKVFESYSKSLKKYQDAINDGVGGDELNKLKKQAQDSFNEVSNSLIGVASDSKVSKGVLNELKGELKGVSNSALLSAVDFDKLSQSTGKSVEELKASLLLAPQLEDSYIDMGDSAEQASISIDDLVKAEMKKATIQEQMVGTTQSLIDQTKDQITAYQMLSNVENLSAEQKTALANATAYLNQLYPEFINNGKLNVEQMRKQVEAEEVLLKAVTDVANGHADAQEIMTTNAALQSHNRIKMISDEIDAYSKLLEAAIMSAANDGGLGKNGEIDGVMTGARANAISMYTDKIAGLKSQVDSLSNSYSSQIQKLANATGYQGQYYNAVDKSKDASSDSIYVTDKYKQSLESLNAQISKMQELQKKYASDSSQYRSALQKEINLQKQKLALMQSQEKSLDQQIKSGKIVQTGMIKSTSPTTTTSTSSPSYSGQYADYINQAASKYGVDPLLIAAIIKQESGFNANAISPAGAKGLMQLMPGTAKELGVKNSFDPYESIMAGTKYFVQQLKSFGGNVEKALAAYNAGAGNVRKYGGIPPFKETQNYVAKIMASYNASTNSSIASGMDALLAEARKQSKLGTFSYKQISGEFTGSYQQFLNRALSDCSQFVQEYFQNFLNTKVPRTAAEQWKAGQAVANGQQQVGDLVFWNTTGKAHSHVGVYSGNGKVMQMGTHGLKEINVNAIKNFEGYRRIAGASSAGSSSVSSASVPSSSAEIAQAKDQATSDLLDIQTDIASTQSLIQQLQEQIVQSKIDEVVNKYEKTLSNLDVAISNSQGVQQQYKEGSRDWLFLANQQIGFTKMKIDTTNQEIAAVKNLIKTEKLSVSQKATLNQKLIDLNSSQIEYLNTIDQIYDKEREVQTQAKEDAVQKLYDGEIKKLQDKLDKLDEIEKKEDRITQQKELQDKIDKAKSDKSHQYIDSNGNVQLTYDKGAVADLEKEMADLKDGWAKEDAKQSLQDQIAALETKRDDSIAALQKLNEDYQTKAFKNTTDLTNTMNQFIKDLAKIYGTSIQLPKHHKGDIVGTQSSSLGNLINKMFNVGSNEQVIKALRGEVVINPNLPNVQSNFKNLIDVMSSGRQSVGAVDQSKHIIIQNLEVRANNPLEFFQGLDNAIRSY
jgi:TP901 family phage tail tape measure protein